MPTTSLIKDASIATGVDSAKIGAGDVSNTEHAYLNSVSSNVQTQIAAAGTDTTPIENDISLLALQTAINGNLSAYGLKNSWIEQFENSTYIENLSTAVRNSSEYISTTPASTGSSVDYGSSVTPTYSVFSCFTSGFSSGTAHGVMTDGDPVTGFGTASSCLDGGMIVDMGGLYAFNSGTLDIGSHRTNGDPRQYTVTYSTDGSEYFTDWNFSSVSSATVYTSGSVSAFSSGTSAGVINIGGHSGTGHRSIIRLSSVPTVTARYIKVTMTGATLSGTGYDANAYIGQFDPNTVAAVTLLASSGSFDSTDVVPQDTTNKSSVGLVVLYKDNAGTNTLNTDIVAKVRANTGQAYQTLVLAGAGTYSNSLKIAIAPAIAVTAGQALSYQISFANQASSKVAYIYGVAMTY